MDDMTHGHDIEIVDEAMRHAKDAVPLCIESTLR